MFENWFQQMYHEVENPYMWLLIFVISLRGTYSNIKKKEIGFAAAFAFVMLVSGFFAGVAFNVIPHSLIEVLFK
ncbi:MAG: hypothetical protein IJV92_01150 [Phascolarctobacterium sp.]|nr:hypothetical protein [Phascolarctobacterium sp.]